MKIMKLLAAGTLALPLIVVPTLVHAAAKNDPYVKPAVKSSDKPSDTAKKSTAKKVIGTAATGEPVYQGPKGGRYHYDSTTKEKIYHPRKTQ
jgi:hypothetical protein